MKKTVVLLSVLLACLFTLSFSSIFSSDCEKLQKIAQECIEEDVFYQELFSVVTGQTFAHAIFIPSQFLSKLSVVSGSQVIIGIIVLNYQTKREYVSFEIGEVSVSGKAKDGDAITGSTTQLQYLANSSLIDMDNWYSKITTEDKWSYLVIVLSNLNINSDFILNLSTEETAASWTVRLGNKAYEKMKVICEKY
jgi:hypothetical protein